MRRRISRALDRIESRVSLGTAILQFAPALGVGAVTAWLSQWVAWINQFGWFGWWCAFLAGAFLAAMITVAVTASFNLWINYSAKKRWSRAVDGINPLDNEFHTKRININDIANPVSGEIKNKRFIDCQIMGPANIAFVTNCRLSGTALSYCDVIVCKHGIYMHNVIAMKHIDIINGDIVKCTIYIPPEQVDTFYAINAPFITFTGNKQIDNQ